MPLKKKKINENTHNDAQAAPDPAEQIHMEQTGKRLLWPQIFNPESEPQPLNGLADIRLFEDSFHRKRSSSPLQSLGWDISLIKIIHLINTLMMFYVFSIRDY